MKTVLMFAEQSHHKALANKIQSITKINSIILYSGELDKKPKISSIPRMIWGILSSVLTGLQFRKSWLGMLNYFEENYLDFPKFENLKMLVSCPTMGFGGARCSIRWWQCRVRSIARSPPPWCKSEISCIFGKIHKG